MPNPQSPIEAPSPASVDGWAAVAAGVVILLIVLGTLPRLLW